MPDKSNLPHIYIRYENKDRFVHELAIEGFGPETIIGVVKDILADDHYHAPKRCKVDAVHCLS